MNWYRRIKYATLVETPRSQHGVEVITNPVSNELARMSREYGEIRCFLVGTDTMFAWSAGDALHYEIRQSMQLPSSAIPLHAGVSGGQIVWANVSDMSRKSDWHENPGVAKAILSNQPFLYVANDHFEEKIKESLGYYNDAIVGDLADLPAQEAKV